MIFPFLLLLIYGIAYFVQRKTPFKFVSMISLYSSRVVFSSRFLCTTPALLIRISSLSYSFNVLEIRCFTSSSLRTSVWIARTLPPIFFNISTVFLISLSFLAAITMFAPSIAKARQIALPIPLLPPVTMTFVLLNP